jgi:thymidylate kinase
MSTSSQLTSKLFEFLNTTANYAVLRNYEGLPLNNSSRDIDILLEKKEFLKIERKIVNLIIASEFKVTTLYRSEKIITYVCAQVSSGKIDLVQFDFFFNTSLFGILLLDVHCVLNSKEFNGAVYHVSKEYEFLDKYLQLKFLNKPYPQKYKVLEAEMRQNKVLPNILKETTGTLSLIALEGITSAKFKRNVFFQNLKRKPFEQVGLLFSFLWNYFKNMLIYKGFSICFTGPDGSGKTTVIDGIVTQLSKTYSSIELFHFRPHLIPNLGEAAKKTKLKSEVDKDFSNPHRGGETGKISSVIRLLYYSIDYVSGYFIKVRPILKNRNLVIFDRYFTDIIADSRRSSIFLNHKFLFWFGKLFIPNSDYNILLTANTETILARKQELTAEGIESINKKLNYLADKNDYYLVLNNGNPAEGVQKIITIIIDKQHQINLKRIR